MTATVDIADASITTTMHGAVAVLSWQRSAKRNAIDSAFADQLASVLREVAESSSAIVLWPQPQFCSGWDIGELQKIDPSTPTGIDRVLTSGRSLLETIDTISAYVVAVVDHVALGFGLAVLAACDYVVSASDATFQLPEIELGLVPSAVLADLTTAIGQRNALRLALGTPADAGTVRDMGLVDDIADEGSLAESVHALVGRLGAIPAPALKSMRELSRRLDHATESERIAIGESFTRSQFLTNVGATR